MNVLKCAVAVLGILNLSLVWGPRTVLDQDDLDIEEQNKTDPALHSVDYSQRSYLKWWCFPSEDVRAICLGKKGGELTECADECPGDSHQAVAEVRVEGGMERFEWCVPASAEDCLKLLHRWKALLRNSSSACFFAAPWSVEEPNHWVVYGIRTDAGREMALRYDPDYEDDGEIDGGETSE